MKVDATIFLWGDKLDPDEVTKALGVAPTRAETKGQSRKLHDGKTVISRTGMWCLCTGKLVDCHDLTTHLQVLHNHMGGKLIALQDSGVVEKSRISVIVSLDNEPIATWEDEVDSKTLGAIARLGASLSIVVTSGS